MESTFKVWDKVKKEWHKDDPGELLEFNWVVHGDETELGICYVQPVDVSRYDVVWGRLYDDVIVYDQPD